MNALFLLEARKFSVPVCYFCFIKLSCVFHLHSDIMGRWLNQSNDTCTILVIVNLFPVANET